MKSTLTAFCLLTILLLQSCSSKRVHEKPNLNLSGEAAQKEYKKFELEHITPWNGTFSDEGLFTVFYMKDFKSTLNEVSPKSAEKLVDLKTKEYIGLGIAAAWIATTFIRDPNGGISPLYWWGFGAFVGYNVAYLTYERGQISDQFNKDLKAKFAPSVGYSFQFK